LFVIANCAHVTESYGDLVAVNEVSLGIEGREIQAGRI
jgi:ABC-type branched-subunit amino acid transport system ATPase component